MALSRSTLVAGTASGSMATLMETPCVGFSRLWCADDPGSDGYARVACDRLHGHAARLSDAGTPGAGGAAQGPAQRSSVCLPRSPKRSCEGDLARWPGSMPVHQKTGERAVHLAFGCGRCSDDLAGAVELSIVRDRLAQPARKPASDAGRIAAFTV